MCKTDSQWAAAAEGREHSSVLSDERDGWDGVGWEGGPEAPEAEDICIQIADSLRCIAEANATS